MGLIGVSTGVFGVYAAAAGALEEQFGYYTVVVAVVVCATSLAELRDRRPKLGKPLLAVASVFVVATLALGISARFTVDEVPTPRRSRRYGRPTGDGARHHLASTVGCQPVGCAGRDPRGRARLGGDVVVPGHRVEVAGRRPCRRAIGTDAAHVHDSRLRRHLR